jgi:hypothetical protein
MLSNNKSQTSHLNKYTAWLLSASSSEIGVVAGLYFGIFMFIMLTLITLIPKNHPRNIPLFIISVAIGSTVAGLFFGKFMAHYSAQQKKVRDEIIGIKLSSKEILELTLWSRKGVKPKSNKLQPVLNNYLVYLEDLTTGKLLPRFGMLRYLTLFIFGIQIPIKIYMIVLEHKNFSGHIFNLIIAILLFSFYASVKPGKSNKIMALISSRQLKKVKKMRASL